MKQCHNYLIPMVNRAISREKERMAFGRECRPPMDEKCSKEDGTREEKDCLSNKNSEQAGFTETTPERPENKKK